MHNYYERNKIKDLKPALFQGRHYNHYNYDWFIAWFIMILKKTSNMLLSIHHNEYTEFIQIEME